MKHNLDLFFYKKSRCFYYSLLCFGLLISSANCLAKTQLSFAVNPSSAAQQKIYFQLTNKFESMHPEIEVNVTSRLLEDHKMKVINYLADKQPFADVFMGYAGTQLNSLIAQELVMPLNDFWEQNQLDTKFLPISKKVVSSNDIVYALPLNYYQWGIYYKKSVFDNLAILPPANWQELFSIITVLRENGIVPFSMGGQSKWSLAAWFDYLNLRLNGLDFHLALLSGEYNFTDQRVVNVFTHWQQLIAANAFDAQDLKLTWKESLPLMYRNYTAMTLMGNFFVAHIPDLMKEDFSFIAFPNVIKEMPRYEDVPFDVVAISKSTKKTEAALAFLKFLADAETQSAFSNYVGKIPPNIHAKVADQYFILEGKRHIEGAAGAAQYFDRDTPLAFSKAAQNVFYEFVKSPNDIDKTVMELEKLRGQYFAITINQKQ